MIVSIICMIRLQEAFAAAKQTEWAKHVQGYLLVTFNDEIKKDKIREMFLYSFLQQYQKDPLEFPI